MAAAIIKKSVEHDSAEQAAIRASRSAPGVRDVSPTGIGLSMSQRFEPGAELIAELSARPDATLLLPVRVVHATQDKNGLWIIGCEFMYQLTEDERRALGVRGDKRAEGRLYRP